MPRFKFTYQECLEDARRFKTINDWQRINQKTYHKAFREKWLAQIIEELGMERQRRKRRKLSYDIVLDLVKHYPTVQDWIHNDPSSYSWASTNGYLLAIHKSLNLYKTNKKDAKIYTFEECIEDAKNFDNISQYVKNGKTYSYAKFEKWLDEIKETVGFKKWGQKKNWWYSI